MLGLRNGNLSQAWLTWTYDILNSLINKVFQEPKI